MKNTAQADRQK